MADLTHVRTCSRSSWCVQCGALIWPYSSRCSLVVMWSKRTSYCMQTPSSLRISSVLVCMSLPYTSIEPHDGAKRPVRRDLGTENDYLLHLFFFRSFSNLLVHFPAAFAVALLQSVTTLAKAATSFWLWKRPIRLISTTLHFWCQVEQNNFPVSSKLLR